MNNERELLPIINLSDPPPCCGGEEISDTEEELVLSEQPWLSGEVDTPLGPLPAVSTSLDFRDTLGRWKARWGWRRMDYKVPPGLYAAGKPDSDAPVLVTANYKLSFDALRRELGELNAWLLVLDTKGINVWCAAGKGTFGTDELVKRMEKTELQKIVSHRSVILPQLGAPGVSAHEVRRRTGFKVKFGPVRAEDLPAFLERGAKATTQMRQVRFNLCDRLTLTPVELSALGKPFRYVLTALILLNLLAAFIGSAPLSPLHFLTGILSDLFPIAGAVIAGTVLFTALLPYIPGRSFAWKGWLVGLLWSAVYTQLIAPGGSWLQTTAYFLALPAIAAFLAMNFTGSSTYTSMSGVLKEMGIALPAIIISASLGASGLIAAYFF